MAMIHDRILDEVIPFLVEDGTMFFVCSDNSSEEALSKSMPAIERCLANGCFQLIDLKSILGNLDKSIISYLFPWMDSSADLYHLVCDWIMDSCLSANEPSKVGLVRLEDGFQIYTSLDIDDLPDCLEALNEEPEMGAGIHLKVSKSRGLDPLYKENRILEDSFKEDDEPTVTLEPEPKIQTIIDSIRKLREEYGISLEEIVTILRQYGTEKLSRLHIDRNGRIFLQDYGNKEIDLDILSRTLYILFLKHPEGISYKCLSDYRPELLGIYSKITNKSDSRDIERTIEHLTDPFNMNQVCIHVARIKKAFLDVMGDKTAEHYYIKGRQSYPKAISLDRDLVRIDC